VALARPQGKPQPVRRLTVESDTGDHARLSAVFHGAWSWQNLEPNASAKAVNSDPTIA
jgi:hypothetical protein